MANLALLALRRDPRLLKLPPYLSALLVIVGVIWLLLLPLDQYSRFTYISENALLPAQVHTYFGGSEQQIFNAYRHEISEVAGRNQSGQEDGEDSYTAPVVEGPQVTERLCQILDSAGLKCVRQKYKYEVAGETFEGENVFSVLRAPRGDATEALVLMAAWTNMDEELNLNGLALVLTLGRYFKRWSLWSKDIIILITPDSKAGPQAWVDAYHDEQNPALVAPLPVKSGALQGAIVIDNALHHTFQAIHIVYDGINGQLPNLDLFNTAVSIATGGMGINIALQRMWAHSDSYQDRLLTMLRGMASQATGLMAGPHSSFVPYHVDAITLQAVGDGPHDEMAMGRVVESIFRSLNNLLEHFHQSFFLYILMQADRFVSIGTYLPSAMLVAANFTVMAIALWIISGRPQTARVASTTKTKNADKPKEKKEMMLVEKDGMSAVVSAQAVGVRERHLLTPVLVVIAAHALGLIPLNLFNMSPAKGLSFAFQNFIVVFDLILPAAISRLVRTANFDIRPVLTRCFSLLILGMFLAALATLNFSLSLFVGLASVPFSFIGPPQHLRAQDDSNAATTARIQADRTLNLGWSLLLQLFSPPIVIWAIVNIMGEDISSFLAEAVFGWKVYGLWTQVVVWCVWWPAWLICSILHCPA